MRLRLDDDRMRAVIRTRAGGALAAVPRPAAGPGDVEIEVAYAGVCRTDLAAADGVVVVADGRVLGHELAGRIAAIGAGVMELAIGDPVTVVPFEAGRWLGLDRDGAFAERVCVPARSVIRLPAGMSLVHGAYVEPVAAALGALAWIARGDRVLVAGTGRIAELTARVVTAHGAEVTREPRGQHDVVIEHAGRPAALLPHVRDGGTLLLKSRARAPVELDAGELVARDLCVRGASHGSFPAAVAWLHGGRIRIDDLLAAPRRLEELEAVFAAARASEAHKQMFAIAERA